MPVNYHGVNRSSAISVYNPRYYPILFFLTSTDYAFNNLDRCPIVNSPRLYLVTYFSLPFTIHFSQCKIPKFSSIDSYVIVKYLNKICHYFFKGPSILGCSKSFESDIYRAVEEPKFLRHFKISSFIWTYPKCHSILSIHCLFTSHLKLTCQCIFVQWKKPNIVQW